ncbi:hypothetical protein GQX73_g7632 [Xylaria multiplex]|uniref:Uncharacterized protein n=1 Tax=Xylaria multiplex TaxID=323545 RepID=A0A7C8IKK2_9PEZI|nr:hypothetical protein GQX73_g7632 [Xylaria multiplex]
MTSTAPPYHITNRSEASLRAPTLPPYTEHAPGDEDIELASLSPSTSASSHAPTTAAGSSSPAASIFTPTKQLQIQTPGKTLLSFPTPPPRDPIPIFQVTASGHLDRPQYLSMRSELRSGSCFLAHGDDETQAALTTTTYRFGPGRRPVVALGDPARSPALDTSPQGEESRTQVFEIAGRSLFSRAVRFDVPGLGSFGWRYGNSTERAAAAADSLLVCEVFIAETSHVSARLGHDQGGSSSSSNSSGKESTVPHRIAQLVRNETFRSPGSTRSSAGNGGRLMLDLDVFDEKRRERVEWLVVTTAVTMLKREVDRRRAQQIATIGAIVS